MSSERREPPLDPATLRSLVEGTAAVSGDNFFDKLVEHLASALGTKCAWVTEWREDERRLDALSLWVGDRLVPDYSYAVAGTPCEPVVCQREFIHVPERVIELYPGDPDLVPLSAVSYMGVPLLETDGRVLGHLAVLDDRRMPPSPNARAIFEIFAGRAAAELRRACRDRRLGRLAAEAAALRAEINALHGFEEIIGESTAIRSVLQDVQQVAGGDTTVLISGETGTGKELIARAIHERSTRAGGPLVRVNCAAIAQGLQESEFFGHVKGAFTGATEARDGRFQLADGGTIFLDEVGDLPLDLQVKLLRVLQEGEFERVGSSTTVKVDVRVLAATNRDLSAMVKEGGFRSDLLYRLNVFPIAVPPLRARGEDVVMLAERFARSQARRTGRSTPVLGEDCKARLRRYDWPGNVRELQNVIERGLITSLDGMHLNLARALPEVDRSAEIQTPMPGRILTAIEMQDFERANLRRALETCDWKVSGAGGAAKLLGFKPSTLSSRMKALGLSRPH